MADPYGMPRSSRHALYHAYAREAKRHGLAFRYDDAMTLIRGDVTVPQFRARLEQIDWINDVRGDLAKARRLALAEQLDTTPPRPDLT